MTSLNNGMQSVGCHACDFISIYYAAFSKRITLETLPGHTPGMGVVMMYFPCYTLSLYILYFDRILITVTEVLTLLLFILRRVVVCCVCVLS